MKKPSVTELIDLLNKPGLMKWANKIGLQGLSIDAYRKQKKEEGTSVHEQINMLISDGTPLTDPEAQVRFSSLMADKKILFSEKSIETEWFVGRYDLSVEYLDKKYIIDFKGGERIYLETVLQLVAYRMAEPCDFIGVIQVPEMKFKPIYQVQNFATYEEIIKTLSSLYSLKNQVYEYY